MFDSIKIYKGCKLDLESILRKLDDFGYTSADAVSQQGDFSIRGGILDVFLLGFDDPLRIELEHTKVSSLRSFDLATGDYIQKHNAVVILPIRGISPKRLKSRFSDYKDEMPINNFVDIDPGDFVVHVEYGIGKYVGLEKLKVGKKYTDHIVIEYADSDRLLVSIDEIGLVQKYIGFEGRPPKLNKLGSRLWKKIKEAAREAAHSFAGELLEIAAKREATCGFGFAKDTDWQKSLELDFPFDETPDQIRCIGEVKQDMESARPMDRLLCGDVGYGKTEIALRAAFKAVMDNKQVAFLVPTTILAEQHHATFGKRLKNFPVNVEMLSRFKSVSAQNIILKSLKEGSVDILIGTHRLLSQDVKFKDLGLVLIDEEQRFGVRHKEKLKKLRAQVDEGSVKNTPTPHPEERSDEGSHEILQPFGLQDDPLSL